MPTKVLVINEWLFHDLQGENGPDKQIETYRFLRAFENSGDRLAFLKESQWAEKSWSLMGNNDVRIKAISRLVQQLLRDSNKCRVLQPEEAESAAPDDAIAAAPDEDVYLIQTYYAADADLLITTDEGLYEAFESRQDVEVIYRDAFLNDYLKP